MQVSVSHDMIGLAKKLNRTQQRQLPKVITQAINKTADNTFTQVKKSINEQTAITQATVAKHLDRKKATWTQQRATIAASTRTFNLIRFATPAAIRTYRKKPGLVAKAWQKRARPFKGVFVGNAARTAFVRTGKGRLPIRPAYGPSIPRAMVARKVRRATALTIRTKWPINFVAAIKRYFPKQ